eukprot:s2782_g10.t1
MNTLPPSHSGSADQPADQRISGSADQPANQRISGSASGSADQRISQRISGSADQRSSQRISGSASGSADQRISRRGAFVFWPPFWPCSSAAVPTAICGWHMRSGSVHCDLELADASGEKVEKEKKSSVKSSDPDLACGELLCFE